MIKIVSYSIVILVLIICILESIKMYKKSETLVEKALYILFMFVIFVPIIIYFLDRYNIPTKFGYIKNLDSTRWFDFFSTYVSTIMGTIVSCVILVLITFKQIKVQIDSNNNDKRIQNSPVLDYSLFVANNTKCNYNHEVKLKEDGNQYHIYFNIENIGMNHCRNLSCKIIVDKEEDPEFFLNKKQSFLKKEEKVVLDLIFTLDFNKKDNRNIKIIVHYEDMLNNKYEQILKSKLFFNKDVKRINVDDLAIENEQLIKE